LISQDRQKDVVVSDSGMIDLKSTDKRVEEIELPLD